MTIREATPDDAEQIIAHVLRMAEEPDKMVGISPGEFTMTVEQERKLLADYGASENSLYLVAEVEGQIVGVLSCTGGNRVVKRHVAGLSISIAQSCRGQGVGSALMERAVSWARGTEFLTRLTLDVYAHNELAIALYRKFGFEEEGVQRRAYFQDGRYIDGVLMGLVW